MGGGLLQLVAYGAQDAYITGNPQITFWKGLFKRHTNFAMEPFRINFTGQPQWGTKQTALVGRHADLLYSTYVELVLPGTSAEVYNQYTGSGYGGFNFIEYAELDVGGQIIDRQYGEFMNLWSYLTITGGTSDSLAAMCTVTTTGLTNTCAPNGRAMNPHTVYIPLTFFFTRNPGAALPLIALQYHEVKINVLWNPSTLLANDFRNASSLPQAEQASLYIDYIYLDTEERRRMAQASHEYLIEQTQFNEEKGIVGANNRIDLTFNHPVKELLWVVQPSYYTDCRLAAQHGDHFLTPFLYDKQPVFDQLIQINGQDRLDRRYADYYSKVQPYQHHSGRMPIMGGGNFMYSFAIRPEEHQPSGTCNFSRIDTATIVMTMNGNTAINKDPDSENYNVRVWAVNYNVLRVMSGMGGLAYSN